MFFQHQTFRRHLLRTAALAMGGLIGTAAGAQDLRNEAPRSVAPPAPQAPAEPARPETADAALTPLAGRHLSGVVFLTDPSQVRPEGWPRSELGRDGIDTSRVPFLAGDRGAREAYRKLARAPVTASMLYEAPRLIRSAFARAGRPFVVVTVPPQDLTDGVLQVLVVEGRLGDVRVRGNRFFPAGTYAGAIRARPGEPVDAARLNEDLRWIGENPFRSASVTAQPGQRPGETDLVIEAQDRRPWRVYAGIDNTGNGATQAERYQVGFNYGNFLGLGHQIAFQRAASPDNHSSEVYAASYVAPLPWRHVLTVNASSGIIRPRLPEPFAQEGHSTQILTRYRMPLPALAGIRHGLAFGFDFKKSDNNLLFSDTPIIGNPTRIYQFSVTWDGQRSDKWGSTAWTATLVHSPGGWGSENQDAAFEGSRTGATARYTYVNITVQRSTLLGAGIVMQNNLALQWSDANLLGSEQLAAAGAYAVRGFEESSVNGDNGYVLRNELQMPAIAGISRRAHARLPGDEVQFFTFADVGRVSQHRPLVGESRAITIGSVGAGLRWQMGSWASLRLEYGKPVHASFGKAPGARWHTSFTVSY
ncbi:MAG: hypothetical protein LBV50_11780 [Novosphingobium sp.]|jgi:hemolysin activation/secretion protein|nr:hypothetical protein [Novosphingobium sp.]